MFSVICLTRIFAGSSNLSWMPIFDRRHFWWSVNATFLGIQENEIYEGEMKENEIYEEEM